MRISPLQTTTVRLTVFACFAFIALGSAVLGLLYWRMLSIIDGQINGTLQRECSDMTAAYEKGGYERLRQTVANRASPSPDASRIYLLVGPDRALIGNLERWPAGRPKLARLPMSKRCTREKAPASERSTFLRASGCSSDERFTNGVTSRTL